MICEKLAQLTPGVMKGTTAFDILTPGVTTTRKDALHRPTHKSNATKKKVY